MKREREEDSITEFFNLDECVDILCLPVPSPQLIAKLLQVSKRMRSFVWRFLVDPVKGSHEWVEIFCLALWEHKNKGARTRTPIDYTGYPIFVSPVVIDNTYLCSTYYVAQKLDRSTNSYLITKPVLSDNEPPLNIQVVRDFYTNVPKMRRFNWFTVARALNIRFDIMIQQYNKAALNTGGLIFRTDTDLLIK